MDPTTLPATYVSHPVTEDKGLLSCPITLYSDGVPYSKGDTFICYYWSTHCDPHTRHLICIIKKSDLCDCGCNGWCTTGAIQRILAWSFKCLSSGVYPEFDHRRRPFADEVRAARRGFPLAAGICGALCEYRADLLEMQQSLGFKNWANVEHPCFCCRTRKVEMFEFDRTVEATRWRERDDSTWRAEVAASMTRRKLGAHQRGLLKQLLRVCEFDANRGGLVLTEDFPPLQLHCGHRLIENEYVDDIHDVASIELPAFLDFFDTTRVAQLNMISPLFSIPGFGVDSLHLDAMHILDLGATQYIAGSTLTALVENNFARSTKARGLKHELPFPTTKKTDTGGGGTGEGKRLFVGPSPALIDDRRLENIFHLRRRFKMFYKMRRLNNRKQLSCIMKLKLKQLSNRAIAPRLLAKAAQTRNLLPLLEQLCSENPDFLGRNGEYLTRSVKHMNAAHAIMKREPRNMSAAGLQGLQHSMARYLRAWRIYGGHHVFKHHSAWDLVRRAKRQGNPMYYWTYADEQMNRLMGTVAKSLHAGSTFYITFLGKILPELS